MRLHPGREIESTVDNPLAPPHERLHEAVRALPSPSSAWIYRPSVLVERLAALRAALDGHVILRTPTGSNAPPAASSPPPVPPARPASRSPGPRRRLRTSPRPRPARSR
jgi:hypothetical protein